jgi:hypothetical protein
MRRAGIALLALGVALVAARGAGAINSPSGIDPRLRFEYDVGRTGCGQPEIQGYIYNDYGRPAYNVRLLAESLDERGDVIDRTYGSVFGIVPVFNRAPFTVPIKTPGATYRLTVASFDWRDLGGG